MKKTLQTIVKITVELPGITSSFNFSVKDSENINDSYLKSLVSQQVCALKLFEDELDLYRKDSNHPGNLIRTGSVAWKDFPPSVRDVMSKVKSTEDKEIITKALTSLWK